MSILVAYGSKRGGTEGLAHTVADALREEGFTVEVAPARTVRRLDGYEAVVVGGALYAFRWHRDARRFVKRHAHDLRARPTYLFSSVVSIKQRGGWTSASATRPRRTFSMISSAVLVHLYGLGSSL